MDAKVSRDSRNPERRWNDSKEISATGRSTANKEAGPALSGKGLEEADKGESMDKSGVQALDVGTRSK